VGIKESIEGGGARWLNEGCVGVGVGVGEEKKGLMGSPFWFKITGPEDEEGVVGLGDRPPSWLSS
jgi:hypothetical protein